VSRALDADVIDQDRYLQAALFRLGADGGDLLRVPVDEEDPLAGALWIAAVGLVERRRDHVLDGLGDRGGYPLVAGLRAGVRLAAGGAAMSSGSRTAGVKSATATISAVFLIPPRQPAPRTAPPGRPAALAGPAAQRVHSRERRGARDDADPRGSPARRCGASSYLRRAAGDEPVARRPREGTPAR